MGGGRVVEPHGELPIDQADEEEAGGGDEVGSEEEADEQGVGSELEFEAGGSEGEEVVGGFGID